MMTEAIDSFLKDHPLKSKWLDDIIGVLIERYSGTAHVDDIAKELYGEHRIFVLMLLTLRSRPLTIYFSAWSLRHIDLERIQTDQK